MPRDGEYHRGLAVTNARQVPREAPRTLTPKSPRGWIQGPERHPEAPKNQGNPPPEHVHTEEVIGSSPVSPTEDSIFFGVLLTPLLRHFPSGLAVIMTALAFGLAHFNGVPSGLAGIILAATWALMLAYLRMRTGGMLATYLAHVVADATIVAVLIPPLLAA